MSEQSPRHALRTAIIAGLTDCPLTPAEAAAFLGIGESSLRQTDIPRVEFFGPKYMKSDCIKYLLARHPFRVQLEKSA